MRLSHGCANVIKGKLAVRQLPPPLCNGRRRRKGVRLQPAMKFQQRPPPDGYISHDRPSHTRSAPIHGIMQQITSKETVLLHLNDKGLSRWGSGLSCK